MAFMSGTHAKRTAEYRRIRIIVGAAVVACLVWAFASLPYDILRAERARLYGEEATTGVVLAVRGVESSDTGKGRLVVDYKYIDPDGFARTASARMDASKWSQYRPGRSVKVIFVRNRPEIVRLPGEEEPAFQLWLRDLMN
ncbi:hypothetical protein JCM14722_27050 [Pseudodesulfovibrio portus]|uniref:DUF3592 domain-containing protein n=2 Tax=Pseudodesulfovibrio portus TaxID=231439 RepID=A0ABM8AUS6_9BACT|nr:hypothetical protein JCM14722_27050 [Pseudodesulfovibrio portus]